MLEFVNNNERFEITDIEKCMITITNEFNRIKFDAVKNNTYCTTIHSSKGLSIGENYVLHQFNNENFDQR
jgi:hypothetical protein